MNQLSFDLLSIFLIVSSIQGFVLGFILISSQKFRINSNIALSVALIVTSLLLLHNVASHIGLDKFFPSILMFPAEMTMLLSASLYYFVHFLVYPEHKFRKKEKIILIPVLLQIIVFGTWYLLTLLNPAYVADHLDTYIIFEYVDELLASVFCFWVLFVSFKKVKKLSEKFVE